MNKLEALKTVRERVESEGTIRYLYCNTIEGKKCFCAVGHLMDVCGIDMNQFIEIPEDFVSNPLNDVRIYNMQDDVLKSLFDAGFTTKELDSLQNANDMSLGPQRKERILEILDSWIGQEEVN